MMKEPRTNKADRLMFGWFIAGGVWLVLLVGLLLVGDALPIELARFLFRWLLYAGAVLALAPVGLILAGPVMLILHGIFDKRR